MIKLLITDLDDTLYSWIGFFIPAFYDMLNELSVFLGKEESRLLQEYKQVHQEKGSVEYPFATLLLPSVLQAYPNCAKRELIEILNPVFNRFNSTRNKLLCLFPQVKETLEWISKSGIIIIGYTDSAEENGFYRLKKLGIDQLFHKVYVSGSQYDFIPSSPKIQVVEGKKPNPELLKQICKKENISVNRAIYVGDSLTKDIYMAKTAGILSIMCKYPSKKNADDLYQKLVAITNWTTNDFNNESDLRIKCESENIIPDYSISSFDEIVEIVKRQNS